MYRYIVAAFVVFIIARSYARYRRGSMSPRRMALLTLFWGGVALVSWMPQWTDEVTRVVGIGRGVDLVFFAAILGLVYLLSVIWSQLEETRQELTQLVRSIALQDVEQKPGEAERPD